MSGKGPRRWLELTFFSAGLAAAAAFVVLSTPALITRFQRTEQPSSSQQSSSDSDIIPAAALGRSYEAGPISVDGSRIGTLTIPALHLTAPVIEGVGDFDLRRGVGHVPGSAQSGGLGNVVLAAHRDTIFRPLRQIQAGMDLQLSAPGGTYHYRVDSMQVVSPDRLDVLDIASEPQVTLITCYPFNFIGSAPLRYVVKAHLVSALPSAGPD